MKGIIGRKVGMTQVYDDKGRLVPVTVLQAGPCTVMDVKSTQKHGYSAVQLGFGERKVKNTTKALIGSFKTAGRDTNPPECVNEIRLESDAQVQVGSVIKADIFKENEFVDISGTTKGKGFQGVVRRYGFAGGRASHGGGWVRKPGSVGQRELPGKIHKNKRMAGHMGNVKRTVQNLLVVKVSPEENILLVKGAVPGPNGGIIVIKGAVKKAASN